MAGCASTPTYPPAPTQTGNVDWNYLVGPGDSVQVFVWRNPEVSGTFPVRPDGKMTMNLIEDLQASGKTPTQLVEIGRAILYPADSIENDYGYVAHHPVAQGCQAKHDTGTTQDQYP